MKLITTASYYGTGSSAITDLLSEYENVSALSSDFECRIAHDMFGLSDLEYYIADNNHRHNSSVAINNFIKLMGIYGLDTKIRMENYPSIFGDAFESAVNEFVKDITVGFFFGGSHSDIYQKTPTEITTLKIKERLFRYLHHATITVNDESYLSKKLSPYDKEILKCKYHITEPGPRFLEAATKFTDNLFGGLCKEHECLMVDQLVPPSNTMRYTRYFNNIKVICVDRDPRDIYYLEKKYWHSGVVPSEVETFIKWYKATRAHKQFEKDDPSVILRIQFEDLIVKYEETVCLIEQFIGLDPIQHISPKTKLNPDVSIKNIGKWKNDESERKNIKLIESCLL